MLGMELGESDISPLLGMEVEGNRCRLEVLEFRIGGGGGRGGGGDILPVLFVS